MSTTTIKKIAVNTGGGDAPGLNAVIKAVTMSAIQRGWEVYGIRDGYNGIFLPTDYPNHDGVIRLTIDDVKDITSLGGTILGTTNRGNPLRYPMKTAAGAVVEVDRSDEIVEGLKRYEIDAVVAIGGDGSLTMANEFYKKGVRIVGVPKTIDNDLSGTSITFGFDTAVSFATECIDRLHLTAKSHKRIMVVEVMGRYAGWIALNSGVSGSADVILIPEIPYDINKVAEHLRASFTEEKDYAIVVVAEGAYPKDGTYAVIEKEAGKAERLGGAADRVAAELQGLLKKEAREVILGHLLRGGSPTTFDRLLSLRFGAAAVRALEEGYSGVMVAHQVPNMIYIPIEEAVGKMKLVDPNSETVRTGRELGICFGD
ncbi:MAG: ATP-dependent 6-phosphofructokinase [Ignavibacteriales bacterium]|nr:MAG: ATP-dependent 6-phosphofructokinase [Ignavibacteriaceae bacterium]MBW7871837.1 ATP-dependent 6-phosphofructokinase [Ignavibacteria bacterium]MCZ2144313.1 ATP-dependent 6-phosphofructokinase [Ignavibacteriales bacterium]OQY75986.1 MAG: 6-phosphofructokinase [Ignavibacteriales bacterium UTCHB3]MBV6446266.1 Pyrophosphate--fructose 6-phosphate 1-phosphotransferase [Ignavibacteriaceae bacterium]